MLQEYWASTVIFIGIFSQCNSLKKVRLKTRVKKRVSERVLPRVMRIIQSETLGETLDECEKSRQETSLDSLRDSRWDFWRDSWQVSERVSAKLERLFALDKRLPESLGLDYPRKKTSLGESLASWSWRVSSLGEIIWREKFRQRSRRESCRESRIGSYAWLSARLSPRLVFLRGKRSARLRY